ncbi:hypothetical protein D3C71_627360 [compost metagenome]
MGQEPDGRYFPIGVGWESSHNITILVYSNLGHSNGFQLINQHMGKSQLSGRRRTGLIVLARLSIYFHIGSEPFNDFVLHFLHLQS